MTTSVAITTYNGRKYIKELLDSIKNQETKPDEVIIVDDSSKDGTYDFVNQYIENNNLSNWHNYKNEENIGWKANFRKVLKKCSGDLIFLCDQDDIWMPNKIGEMKSVMESTDGIQLLFSNYAIKYVDRKEKIKVHGLDRDDGTVEKLSFNSHALAVMRPGCTYCVSRDLVAQLWEDDIITAPHDVMLWGYAAIDETMALYNRQLIQFRRHLDSASTPTKELCRSRRLTELTTEIGKEEFFLNICKKRKYYQKERIIEEHIKFIKKRKEILERRSLIGLLWFQIRNYKKYPTHRNMLSDEYVLVVNKN